MLDRHQQYFRENGFSLPELMMSAVLLLILLGAIFSALYKGQRTYPSEQDIAEATQNARYALDFMSSIIRQAGNDPARRSSDPCVAASHPSIQDCTGGVPSGVVVEPVQPGNTADRLRVLADITGSAPGNPDKGDPNGDTCGAYEDVTFLYNSNTREIQMILRNNGTPIPIAKNINNLRFSYLKYDAGTGGYITAQPVCQAQVVRIAVNVGATNTDEQAMGVSTVGYTLTSDVQIRSRN